MTPEDFEHWKDFALRMAKLPSRTPPRKWVVEQVGWFFEVNNHPKYDVEDVTSWDQGESLVCDKVSEFLWDRQDEALARRGLRSEEARRNAEERWMSKWGNAVSCCIRAGLDLVAEPSMGVLGYTMGDLRKMYPEGFPPWLEKVLNEFVDHKKKPVKLKKLKDNVRLWL